MKAEVTYEFGTPDWYALAERELRAALAEAGPEVAFSFSEHYRDGDAVTGWHVRHRNGVTTFAAEPAEDVDCYLVTDIEIARASASRPPSDEVQALLEQALADGRTQWFGDLTCIPPEMRQVHDRMLAQTAPE